MRVNQLLSSAGIEAADAQVLLASVLGVDRSWLLAHATDNVARDRALAFEETCLRRAGGEPVAYILGERSFYGRSFSVTPDVLVPRPATEGLVEAVMRLYKKIVQYEPLRWHTEEVDSGIVAAVLLRERGTLPPLLVDIGTGSGCIAVTLACELPETDVIATDVSSAALDVARGNVERFGVGARVNLRRGSLLQPLAGERRPFILVSNPPYVPEKVDLPADVRREPASAIVAGADGMDVLHPLIREAWNHPSCYGIAVECRAEQVARFPVVSA
ncbi:MAG: release factor glutamine methyltransferase [Candidatus Peregrinibacteria bacterium Gr01-1014_25]|nr:MAG: release factor glutamine methyltransferase [Candidatus Peregrinibacteria bacterium Gr01-1014_25]